MAFDPETAYAGDYTYNYNAKDATFTPKDAAQDGATGYAVKLAWADNDPKRDPTGSRMGLSQTPLDAVMFKAGSGAPDPKEGDALTVESVAYSIIRAEVSRRSRFPMTVIAQTTNS